MRLSGGLPSTMWPTDSWRSKRTDFISGLLVAGWVGMDGGGWDVGSVICVRLATLAFQCAEDSKRKRGAGPTFLGRKPLHRGCEHGLAGKLLDGLVDGVQASPRQADQEATVVARVRLPLDVAGGAQAADLLRHGARR